MKVKSRFSRVGDVAVKVDGRAEVPVVVEHYEKQVGALYRYKVELAG